MFSQKGIGFSHVGETPNNGVDGGLKAWLKHPHEKMVKINNGKQ